MSRYVVRRCYLFFLIQAHLLLNSLFIKREPLRHHLHLLKSPKRELPDCLPSSIPYHSSQCVVVQVALIVKKIKIDL